MKAVVCGRNFTSRLGMVRAIGSMGYKVILVRTNEGHDVDTYSKYVVKEVFSRETEEGSLVRTLMDLSREESEKMLLLPTDDFCAAAIDEAVDVLKEKYLFQNIDMTAGAVRRIMEKDAQKEIAQRHGLDVAAGWLVSVKEGQFSVPDDIRYPCFAKPLVSIKGTKLFLKKCETAEELRSLLDKVASMKGDCDMMIEEFVPIEKELAVVGFCDGENVVIPGVIHMLLDGMKTHRGVTCVGKVYPVDAYEDFLSRIKEMMKSLHFVGLFDVDAYSSGGKVYFNELNVRFGASGYAITASGINLPAMMAACLTEGRKVQASVSLEKEIQFVSEKALLELWRYKGITWKEYMDYVRTSDVRFIRSMSDIVPYLLFQYKIVKAWVQR